MFEAMVFILRTGIPWRDLPARYGPWNSVYTRWRRWCQRGLWPRLLAVLARNAQGKLRFLDASHVKVHQDASNPAGGHWTHQRWAEHQDQCVGGRARTSGEFELGPRTARRCVRRADCGTSAIAWYDYGGRQGLRQRWFSRAVAALGQSPLHSTSLQPTQTCGLASWSLQETAQGGKLVSTIETLSQNWDSL